jgi:hypothetical protein
MVILTSVCTNKRDDKNLNQALRSHRLLSQETQDPTQNCYKSLFTMLSHENSTYRTVQYILRMRVASSHLITERPCRASDASLWREASLPSEINLAAICDWGMGRAYSTREGDEKCVQNG